MPTLRRIRIVSALRVVLERVPIHVLNVKIGHASVDAALCRGGAPVTRPGDAGPRGTQLGGSGRAGDWQ